MPFSRSSKRYGHLNGFTVVVYSDDGSKIITSGNDGDIRIWSGIGDDDPSSFCIGEFGYSMAQFDGRILVNTDINTVQAYKFPEFEKDGVEFRFTAPVTSIKYNKKYFACGSEDFDIKVQVRDKSEDPFELKGEHLGPILNIDLSVKNLLVSASGDGTIKIWSLEKKEVIKTIDGLLRVNCFQDAKYYVTPCFEPQFGRYLAYAKDNNIFVLETNNWTTKFTLSNNQLEGKFTCCSFSTCGEYIAAGTDRGEITVWNLNKNCIVDGEYEGIDVCDVTSIAWNPTKNGELAYCDREGQLGTVLDCYGSSDDNESKKENEKVKHDDDIQNDPDDLYGGIDFHGYEDEDDDDNVVSLEKIKNETLKTAGAMEYDEDDNKSDKTRPYSSLSGRTNLGEIIRSVKLQQSFQPGSTPIHLEHRFMVWNHTGIVTSHRSDTENSILVEFHDVTVHPSLHMTNNFNHQMSSLSPTCLALATNQTPCRLVCIALGASGSKEWSVTLPDIEEISAVAASETFVAISTDMNYLRFFTVMGTQREILSLPGPVVAMSGYDDKILVAYHNSKVENDVSLMLIHSVGLTLMNRDLKMPLTPNSKLTWLGFSDKGSPVTYDSAGILRMYSIRRNVWYPICDTNVTVKSASENYFIISVSEKDQNIRTVLCRGTSYPLTNPRPFVHELKFCLPFCDLDTEKSKFEEVLVRSLNFNMDSARKSCLEKALKLFTAALNSEMESRAFELIDVISDQQLIELSAKYASSRGRLHMAEKILKLLEENEEKQKEKTDTIHQYEHANETYNNSYETSLSRNTMDTQASENTPKIAPKPLMTQKNRNPFKKNSTLKNSTPTNALTHLTSKGLNLGSSVNMDSDDENVPANVSNASSNRSVCQDTPRPNNFMAWFNANKDDLKNTHPDISDAELSKVGIKVYRELTKHQKLPTYDDESKSETMTSKRKLDLKETEGNSAASKLAKFMINK